MLNLSVISIPHQLGTILKLGFSPIVIGYHLVQGVLYQLTLGPLGFSVTADPLPVSILFQAIMGERYSTCDIMPKLSLYHPHSCPH